MNKASQDREISLKIESNGKSLRLFIGYGKENHELLLKLLLLSSETKQVERDEYKHYKLPTKQNQTPETQSKGFVGKKD